MKQHKPISVIIPTYNRSKSILRSIQSVIDQTYPVDEIIIADDGSTDDTKDVLASIKDARVKFCSLPENRGAGGARNYGVSKARNEIIAFHDSDDEWHVDKIEKQMAIFESHPECGLIYTAYRMHLVYGIEHIVPDLNKVDELSGDIFANLLVRNTIGAPTVLMRKSIFEEVGGFDEKMRSLEDWDFALKVAGKYPIGFVAEPLLEVEQTQGSVSSAQAAYYQNRCYMLRKYRNAYLKTNTLNKAVSDILMSAQKDGIQQQVEKMLILYMS